LAADRRLNSVETFRADQQGGKVRDRQRLLLDILAGYTASAVDDLPVQIAVAAGLVAFALTTFNAVSALHRLVKP
jgi:hypothetical protein